MATNLDTTAHVREQRKEIDDMEVITTTKYKCSICGNMYDSKMECEAHENKHKKVIREVFIVSSHNPIYKNCPYYEAYVETKDGSKILIRLMK